MIPLLLTDPINDDYGLGYAYPRAALYTEAGFADLLGFEAISEGQQLVLRVKLNQYPNPNNAPNGFSLATVAIYVDTGPGGSSTLPGAGFKVPGDHAWDKAYLLTGWASEEHSSDGKVQTVPFRRKEDWLELRPKLPTQDYSYYVAVGIYDPFTPWHFRPVRSGGGPWVLDGPTNAPPAVDVLAKNQNSAFETRVLDPVKAPQDRKPWAYLTAAVGLLFILLAFRFPRR